MVRCYTVKGVRAVRRKQEQEMLHKIKLAVATVAVMYMAFGVTLVGQRSVDNDFQYSFSTQTYSDPVIADVSPIPAIEHEDDAATDACIEDHIVSYGLSADDEYLLAKIAMAEAEDQSTEGKALVMLVVLNRVHSGSFPDSISDVIFADGQFSPVDDGRYDAVDPDADCWKALELIKSGWDESQGALYFESESKSEWHRKNLQYLFQNGNHYFYTEKEAPEK